MKILIVDDSALARGIIRRTLEENGAAYSFTLLEAKNGDEAKATLAAGGIDLVMVDWAMPVLDGLSFVRHARASGVTIPIVMITAVTDEAKIHEAVEAGVTEYIEKPIRPADLWARIRELLLQ